MNYNIYRKYLQLLIDNQRDTNIECLQDIYTKKDYENLLKPVLKLIKEYPDRDLTFLKLRLFLDSGLKEMIDNFVKDTKITPGLILDFGTFKNRDTVICGNMQEVKFSDGKFREDIIPIKHDTIFDLASTSKIFMTVAILILNEKGIIDVFDPVRKYVKEFKNLKDITIYDLLKFRKSIVSPRRIDEARDKDEALELLYSVYPRGIEPDNAYTDMGAMVLRVIVEKVTHITFNEFLESEIFKKCKMKDTYLNVPRDKIKRVANENYSSIVRNDGLMVTRFDNNPGTVHDPKANCIGHRCGVAPGHAGYFSTRVDMINFAKSLINEEIINKESLYSISETATGFQDEDKYTRFYGSLVYLKQPDPNFLSVYPPLSGKAFMSPGFAGTHLVIDPLNKITLFLASPRLHNRVYDIAKNQVHNIVVDENDKKTYILKDGTSKIISSDFTKKKEKLVRVALDLSIRYQLLEKIYPREKEMHLVRELD